MLPPSAGRFSLAYPLQLQKNTTWKDVKDFLRLGGVEMDHVEVFPSSRDGWVRVYGQDNYYKAMRTSFTV
jgi:hypothetical protein